MRRRRRPVRQEPDIQLPQVLIDAFAGHVVAERLEQLARALEIGAGLVPVAHSGAKSRILAVYIGLETARRLAGAAQLDSLLEEHETVLVALAAPQLPHD